LENCNEDSSFDRLGYVYRDDLSSDNEIVFEKTLALRLKYDTITLHTM